MASIAFTGLLVGIFLHCLIGHMDSLADSRCLEWQTAASVPSPRVHWWNAAFSTVHRSEGSGSPMGTRGVGTTNFTEDPSIVPTKTHGFMPTLRDTSLGHTIRSTHKRSVARAYKRACLNDFAWYKGRNLTPGDFGFKNPPKMIPPRASGCKAPQSNRHQASQRRLAIVQWNAGGLGRDRFLEFCSWCTMQHVDVISVAETRWTFSTEWFDDDWIFLHDGDDSGSDRGSGQLVMISKRFLST